MWPTQSLTLRVFLTHTFMSENLTYPWAVAYHQAGWCVLPAKNKYPLKALGGWKQYQEKRPSLDQVQEWFEDAPNDAQIALVTGKVSGVTVIDIDTHKEGCKGKKGGDCKCNPEDPASLALAIGLSMQSNTGSGGYHVFCTYENVGNSVGLAHPQLDIRSDGGIIILPPSLHENGKNYVWDELLTWHPDNIKALLPFPTELKTLLYKKKKTNWNLVSGGVGEGKRNDVATSVAGKLIGAFERDEIQAAWNLLWAWNKQNEPPLPEAELRRTFKSVLDSEYGKQ